MIWVLAVLWIAFAVSRFAFLPAKGTLGLAIYKDLAHVFVGFLFGAAAFTGSGCLWGMAGGLTAVEIAAFVVRREP